MWLVDCTYYIDDFYHTMHHQNYGTTGDVVKFHNSIMGLVVKLPLRILSPFKLLRVHVLHVWMAAPIGGAGQVPPPPQMKY